MFDVIVDRENRQYFDILFDKPLGQGKVAGRVEPPPTVQTRPYPKHMDGTDLRLQEVPRFEDKIDAIEDLLNPRG